MKEIKIKKIRISGNCEDCKLPSLVEIYNEDKNKITGYECLNCDWKQEKSDQKVIVRISKDGAMTVSERLRNLDKGETLDIATKDLNLIFIINK